MEEKILYTSTDGTKCYFRKPRAEQDFEVFREVYLADGYRLRDLKRLGYSPKFIVDVGGHIGSFILIAKKIWPEASVISFEPNRESYSILEQNIRENNLENVFIYNMAINYDPEKQYLLDGKGSTGGCVLKSRAEAERLEAEPIVSGIEHYSVIDQAVQSVKLEDILVERNVLKIDLLKLDCEGSEVDLVRSIDRKIAESVNFILGEYHLQGGFEEFKRISSDTFEHLHFFGGSDHPAVGPFWATLRAVDEKAFWVFAKNRGLKRRVRSILRLFGVEQSTQPDFHAA